MRLIDIKRDEIGKVLLFGLMLGIRTAGCTIGWAAVQAILMKRLGVESLPYSFIFFALVGMTGSFIYVLFADIIRRGTLLKIFCTGTAIVLTLAGVFIPEVSNGGELSTGFYISCILILIGNGIGYSTTGIQIWTIINDAFRPSEGTRIYPIIATAPLLGSIGGGAITPLMIDHLGMKSLFIIWGLSMLSVLPLFELLRKYYGEDIIAKATYLKNLKSSSNKIFSNLKEGFLYSLKSPFVLSLSSICILFWTVASLKEFQYGIIMDQTFRTEEELSKFFANFNVYLHVTVFVIQLLFTGRIIKLIGVGRGFLILPITIFFGILSIAFSFSFYTGFAMRFTWDIAAMTVQGSIFQLAFNGIYGPYRGRVRGLLEGFVNPIGGVIGGLTIIFINSFIYAGNEVTEEKILITILGLVFSFLWILAAINLKKKYEEITLKNLKSDDRRTFLDAIEMVGEMKKSRALELLREVRKKEDEQASEIVSRTIEFYGYQKD